MGRLLKFIWWKPRAIRTTKHILPHIPDGARVLDIGAGSGLIAQELAERKDVKITLIDVIDWNTSKFPITIFDGRRIPFGDKQFDVALLVDVVHHSEDEELLVKEALRVAGKVVVLEEVHEHNGMNVLANIADNVQCVLYGMPVGVHHRNMEQWQEFFKRHSMLTRCVGQYFHHAVFTIQRYEYQAIG